MSKKVEFIESYTKGPSGHDYAWNDNHGELIRCKDCKYYAQTKFFGRKFQNCMLFTGEHNPDMQEYDYCSKAVKKDVSSSSD